MKPNLDRFITVRLPADVDQSLRQVAQDNTRTLMAQVLHYIKQGLAKEIKGSP